MNYLPVLKTVRVTVQTPLHNEPSPLHNDVVYVLLAKSLVLIDWDEVVYGNGYNTLIDQLSWDMLEVYI